MLPQARRRLEDRRGAASGGGPGFVAAQTHDGGDRGGAGCACWSRGGRTWWAPGALAGAAVLQGPVLGEGGRAVPVCCVLGAHRAPGSLQVQALPAASRLWAGGGPRARAQGGRIPQGVEPTPPSSPQLRSVRRGGCQGWACGPLACHVATLCELGPRRPDLGSLCARRGPARTRPWAHPAVGFLVQAR